MAPAPAGQIRVVMQSMSNYVCCRTLTAKATFTASAIFTRKIGNVTAGSARLPGMEDFDAHY